MVHQAGAVPFGSALGAKAQGWKEIDRLWWRNDFSRPVGTGDIPSAKFDAF